MNSASVVDTTVPIAGTERKTMTTILNIVCTNRIEHDLAEGGHWKLSSGLRQIESVSGLILYYGSAASFRRGLTSRATMATGYRIPRANIHPIHSLARGCALPGVGWHASYDACSDIVHDLLAIYMYSNLLPRLGQPIPNTDRWIFLEWRWSQGLANALVIPGIVTDTPPH